MATARPLFLYEKSPVERGRALVRDLSLALENRRELKYLFTANAGDSPQRPETSPDSYENTR